MFQPMLADRLNQDKLPKFASDDDYWFERKLDGMRQVIVAEKHHAIGGTVRAWGRVNEAAPNREIAAVLGLLNGRWVFDGELVDGVFWAFDLLVEAGSIQITENSPYIDRRNALDAIAATLAQHTDKFRVLPTARTTEEKVNLALECKRNHYEGVMVKHKDGKYHQGRRSHTMLKAKFVETADCVVDEINRQGKRSIGIALYDDKGQLVNVGACTILNDKKRAAVQVGDVVEVKYLYATKDHKIYQPAFLTRRDDKLATDCNFGQLKYTNKQIIG